MTKTLHATFDGHVLRPEEPLPLPANTRVVITVSTAESPASAGSFLKTAQSLKLEGPSDWSERLEEYLYPEGSNGHE
jgi:hypothetical protein